MRHKVFRETAAQRRQKERIDKHGHAWVCGHLNARKHRCGRTATVIWARVNGTGSAWLACCATHGVWERVVGWPTEELREEDFLPIKPGEMNEFVRAKRLKRQLIESDPNRELSIAEQLSKAFQEGKV
jgi:hypothetical protein